MASSPTREVIKYTFFCVDEGTWITTDFLEEQPTKCPNGDTHVIQSITVVDTISTTMSTIKEDDSGTQGFWRVSRFTFDVNAGIGTYTDHNVEYPYPVKIYNLTALVRDDNVGDELEVFAMMDTDIGVAAGNPALGVITEDVAIGTSTFKVDVAVLSTLNMGFLVKLKEGATEEDLGECIDIDKDNSTITVSGTTTNAYTNGNGKVLFTIVRFEKFPIVNNQNIVFGDGKIGGTLLAKGAKATIRYHNNTALSKKFCGLIEIDY